MLTQASRGLMHHTLGNGEYDLFRRMSEPVVCASAVMTPENVAHETERLIHEALYHRRRSTWRSPRISPSNRCLARPIPTSRSDPGALKAAADAVVAALDRAGSACILAGFLVSRTGRRAALQALVDASGLPFATMLMDKAALDEQQPAYIGIYNGRLMNEGVRDFVEDADCVVSVGAPLTDFNTGAFTSHLDPAKTVTISHHRTQVGGKVYSSVEMTHILAALTQQLPKRDWKRLKAAPLDAVVGGGKDPISAEALYPRWEKFLKPNDIFVVETGTVSMRLGFALLPEGATFHNQTLWGSIGWATPAAFGAAVADPSRRTVLVTGDGAHQLTAQEIGQFGRLGLKPIVFLLNNDGYLIERLLCKEPAVAYNDIARWRYAELPKTLGIDGWMTARVTTCGEFDAALEAATKASTGAYIEVVTDPYFASPLAMKLHDAVKTLYKA